MVLTFLLGRLKQEVRRLVWQNPSDFLLVPSTDLVGQPCHIPK
jgi:hypothetical protein